MAFARVSAELRATRTTPLFALATDPAWAVASGNLMWSGSSTGHLGLPALCGSGQDDRALGRAFRGNGAAPARVRNRGRYHEYATDSRECSVDKIDLSLEARKLSLAWRSHQTNTLRYR